MKSQHARSLRIACVLFCATVLAEAMPQIQLDSVSGAPGQRVDVPLRLSEATAPYSGFNAIVYLPAGVQFETVRRGAILPATDFYLTARALDDPAVNAVAVLGYSVTQTFGSDGVLCLLQVRVATDATPGDYPLVVDAADRSPIVRGSHALASSDGQQSVAHSAADGILQLAFGLETTARGTPHWWLAGHNLTTGGISFEAAEQSDSDRDGAPAWKEYVADTDPTDPDSYFRILAIEAEPSVRIHFEPASTGRLYTLLYRTNLLEDAWTPVPGLPPRPGTGAEDAMLAPDIPGQKTGFFGIGVELPVPP